MRKRNIWLGEPFTFTIREFAAAHRIGRNAVYEEIKAERLTSRKIGRRTVVTAEDALRWREALPDSRTVRRPK